MIAASRLLKSCATPAVSRPTAAIVCAWRSRSSVCRRAVTSVYSVTKPPPGSGLRLISSCRPLGRARSIVPMAAPERSSAIRRATSASTSTGPNSPAATWPRRISSIGRPTRRISAGTPVNSGKCWFHAISRRSPSTIMMPSLMPVSVASRIACSRASASCRRRAASCARSSSSASSRISSVMPPVNSSAFVSQSAAARIASARSTPTTTFRSTIRNGCEGIYPVDIVQTPTRRSSFPRPTDASPRRWACCRCRSPWEPGRHRPASRRCRRAR